MAQMPRGEPRSVPDRAGDQYDEMIRLERRRKLRAEAGAVKPTPPQCAVPLSRFGRRLDFAFRAPGLGRTVAIGDQAYREVDNGRGNVLVPVDDPLVSPAERAERRQAIARSLFVANNPLAGAGYGLATLAKGSPRVRDGALVAGAVADAVMMGSAPRGASIRSPVTPPRRQLAPPTTTRPRIRYRELNANGQATGVNATLTKDMLGSGTRVRWNPPGWQGHGTRYNEARAHLHAKQLGGPGRDRRNAVTMTHRGANTPQMSGFENGVARRVRAGEVVEYSSTPLYESRVAPPSAILLTAHGSRGAPTARLIHNPAGRRK